MQHVEIASARKGRPGVQGLVEATGAESHTAPERHVASGTEPAGGEGIEGVALVGRSAVADLLPSRPEPAHQLEEDLCFGIELQRQDEPRDGGSIRMLGPRRSQGVAPPTVGHGVVVEKGHDLMARLSQGTVAGDVETGDRLACVPHPRERGHEVVGRRPVRGVVDDEDLEAGSTSFEPVRPQRQQGLETHRQAGSPAPRADGDGERRSRYTGGP